MFSHNWNESIEVKNNENKKRTNLEVFVLSWGQEKLKYHKDNARI